VTGALALSVVDLTFALLVVAALVVVTTAVGLLSRRRQGRARAVDSAEVVDPRRIGADALGSEATLLQFSTEMCARCPGVHRMLSAVAADRDGVRHLDVDLTHRPDLAQHFRVLQTPTTLVLDHAGVVRTRFGGTPARAAVELELARLQKEIAHD
jgi:thiol-disulfide isomerase/thioredoxin